MKVSTFSLANWLRGKSFLEPGQAQLGRGKKKKVACTQTSGARYTEQGDSRPQSPSFLGHVVLTHMKSEKPLTSVTRQNFKFCKFAN